MPTLQQWVNEQKARGVSREDIASTFKEAYGEDVTSLDADTDYDAYKARKRPDLVKPPTPAPVVAAPAPAPVQSLELPSESVVTSSSVGREGEEVKRGDQMVWSPSGAVRGLLAGAAKGVLGDTMLTRGLDAARSIAESIPSPVEVAGLAVNEALDPFGKQLIPEITGPSAGQRIARVKRAVAAVPQAKSAVVDVDYAARTLDRAIRENEKARQAIGMTGDVGKDVVQALANAGVDLSNLARGIIDLGSTVFAPKNVYRGVTAGDVAFKAGEEMGKVMPGQVLDLARGIADPDANSFATNPFTTWMMVVDPALKGYAKSGPKGAAAAAKVRKAYAESVVKPAVDNVVNSAVESAPVRVGQDIVTAIKQSLEDGIINKDPRLTAMMEDWFYGGRRLSAAIKNAAELEARQVAQGLVEAPPAPDLQPTRVTILPPGDVRAAASAAKEATVAAKEAGIAGGIADAAAQTAAETKALASDVGATKRAAIVRRKRIIDGIIRELEKPVLETARQKSRAAAAAVPGIELAEKVTSLSPDAAKGMSAETAAIAGRSARAAERSAVELAREAESAGALPQVEAGTAYLPESAQTAPGRLAAFEEGRGEASPSGGLAEALGGVPAEWTSEMVAKAREASKAKAKALDALGAVDLETLAVDIPGITAEKNLYAQARELARRLNERNIDNASAVLAREVEQISAQLPAAKKIARASSSIADWLLAEISVENLVEAAEQKFGGVRRPVRVVESMELTPEGKIIQRPEFLREIAEPAFEALEPGSEKTAASEIALAKSVDLPQEPPKGFVTGNEPFDTAAKRMGDLMRERGYDVAGKPTASIPLSGGLQTLKSFTAHVNAQIRRLTNERIAQRQTEFLERDTGQLVRDRRYRGAMIQRFRQNAIDRAGLSGKALREAVANFNELLLEPSRAGSTSKNRMFTIGDVWTLDDWKAVVDTIPRKRLDKIRADSLMDAAQEVAGVVQARDLIVKWFNEVERFRVDENGNPLPATYGSVDGYAKSVANGVIGRGVAPPALMPYEGKMVAAALRANADKLNLPANRVMSLANSLEKYPSATGKHGVGNAAEAFFGGIFHDTAAVPDLTDIYVNPGVLKTIRGELALVQSVDSLGLVPAILRETGQLLKKGAVALNLRALTNNNLSNSVFSAIRRGDPGMVIKLPFLLMDWRNVLDGNTGAMAPGVRRMYEAIQRTDLSVSNEVSRDIGASKLIELLEKFAPDVAKSIRAGEAGIQAAAPKLDALLQVYPQLRELQTKLYTSAGDLPFRLYEAVETYTDAQRKVNRLAEGQWVELPVGRERNVLVTKVGPDTVQLVESKGAKAVTETVNVASERMADVLAETANFSQERSYFDYSKIGNFGKTLRGGSAALLSGIFTWFFKSTTVPFLKKGLVGEMMGSVNQYRTNSPAVKVMQASDAAALANRRALFAAAAYAMLTDERQLDGLARALGYNPTTAAALFDATAGLMPAVALNPLNIVYRNVEPVLFTGPTQTALAGLESIVSRAEYGDIFDNPAALSAALLTDPAQLAAMPPDEAKRVARMQQQLRRVLRGQQFNLKQFLQIAGLGGGPLLNLLERMKASEDGGRPFSVGDGMAEFARLVFGATPSAAVDVAASVLGENGVTSAAEWGGYGKEQIRRGFTGGTQTPSEGLLAYGIRQMLGIGQLSQYAGLDDAESPATGKDRFGKLDGALALAEKLLQQTLVKPAQQKAEFAYLRYERDPTPENKKAFEDAAGIARTAKTVLTREVANYRGYLREQKQRWIDRRK